MEYFHEWVMSLRSDDMLYESSLFSDAVTYTLNQWDKLVNCLRFSFVTLDNNASERGIRIYANHRKSWLFSGSGDGARSSCFLYTLTDTARANGLNPEKYLETVFLKAPYVKTQEDWEKLLPWNIEITPDKIRGK